MPRRSYAEHRAARAASIADETDLESLASYSTYSASVYSASPAPASVPPHLRQRVASNLSAHSQPAERAGSSSSHVPSPRGSHAALAPHYSPLASSSLTASPAADKVRLGGDAKRRSKRRRGRTGGSDAHDSPLRTWARFMGVEGHGRATSLAVGLIAVGIVKSAVGMGGFSGQGQPPMHGDFEAQRHWMEVTLHRPVSEWYTYSPEWWQLDYPPLTAYVSYVCGWLGSLIDPRWFALDTSRTNEDPLLVHFMRMSVLSLEAAVWWTAVVVWVCAQGRKGGRTWRTQLAGIMTVLLQPSLALIDNGHFQYNAVLLGLSVAALYLLQAGRDGAACIAFSLALGFKQMGLYYAPAIGCYLVGKCIYLGWPAGLALFAKLALSTSATLVLLFLPWLRPFPDALFWVVHRIFPLARGIFEDKVANFWCASNVVLKWRKWFDAPGMARLALAATLVALLPTIIILIQFSYLARDGPRPADAPDKPTLMTLPSTTPSAMNSPAPTAALLPLAMLSSSLSFFLFSFQVHEKSILLALAPLSLMMALRGDDVTWELGVLVNNVAVFSMWPLLKRDGQAGQYTVLLLLWNYLIGADPRKFTRLRWASMAIYAAMGALHLAEMAIAPPARYPDLYPVLNVLLSSAVFGATWLWANWRLLLEGWAVTGRVG